MKINRLLTIYTSNVLLKFGLDIYSQTKIFECDFAENQHAVTMRTCDAPLEFGLRIQRQITVRVRKPNNSIWLPGGHTTMRPKSKAREFSFVALFQFQFRSFYFRIYSHAQAWEIIIQYLFKTSGEYAYTEGYTNPRIRPYGQTIKALTYYREMTPTVYLFTCTLNLFGNQVI